MRHKADLAAHAGIFVAKVLLRTLGYTRTSRILTVLSPHPHPSEGHPKRIVRAVSHATAHRFFGATCLERSLAAWWLLRWKRIPARVCIGARYGERGFEAHAWLEQAGHVLNDDPTHIATYAAFPADLSPDRVLR